MEGVRPCRRSQSERSRLVWVARERQIVGLGGHGDTPEQTRALHRARPGARPARSGRASCTCRRRSATPTTRIVALLRALAGLGELAHLSSSRGRRADLRELVLAQDAISVGGGNTANMLAIWRVHGFDRHPARGVGGRGRPLRGERRDDLLVRGGRHRLVRARSSRGCATGSASSPAAPARTTTARRCAARATASSSTRASRTGVAADDGVGLHYVGTELREVVTCRPGAAAYRVTRDGEERLEPRLLAAGRRRRPLNPRLIAATRERRTRAAIVGAHAAPGSLFRVLGSLAIAGGGAGLALVGAAVTGKLGGGTTIEETLRRPGVRCRHRALGTGRTALSVDADLPARRAGCRPDQRRGARLRCRRRRPRRSARAS